MGDENIFPNCILTTKSFIRAPHFKTPIATSLKSLKNPPKTRQVGKKHIKKGTNKLSNKLINHWIMAHYCSLSSAIHFPSHVVIHCCSTISECYKELSAFFVMIYNLPSIHEGILIQLHRLYKLNG